MKKRYLVPLLTLAIGVYSCSSEKPSDAKTDTTEVKDSPILMSSDLKREYDSLTAITDFYWDTLTKMDDEKFECLERLYDEMEIMPKSNSFKIAKLRKRIPKVLALRYTQKEMTSRQIDEYDNATTKLIIETKTLASETEDFSNYQVALQMLDLVTIYDGNAFVGKRLDYSEAADVRNEFINNNKAELEKIGLETVILPNFLADPNDVETKAVLEEFNKMNEEM